MNAEKGIYAFWIGFGLFISVESYRLDLGKLRSPDAGLFPFITGIIIVALASALLLRFGESDRKKGGQKDIRYLNIVLALIGLYLYAWVLEWLGFVLSTFLFIFFLLKVIENKGWAVTFLVAFCASSFSYLLFDRWLHAALPRGILGM